MLKNQIINRIIEVEGGYSNNPKDSGGATMFGVTEKVARAHGYQGSMDKLPYSVAFDIYSTTYWDSLRLDDVQEVSLTLAAELADTGINMGVKRASIFLQRSLNVLNRGQKDFRDLTVDGMVGNATIGALKAFYNKRGTKGMLVLENTINCLQGASYVELCERREKDEDFMFGWMSERIGLR